MRAKPIYLLAAVLACATTDHVLASEEAPTGARQALNLPSSAEQIADLRQRLADTERQRDELAHGLRTQDSERDTAQVARLRQENQRLRLQLKEAQTIVPPRLLTDQQQWFVTGGGVALVALLCGIFASGWRRQRRQWLN